MIIIVLIVLVAGISAKSVAFVNLEIFNLIIIHPLSGASRYSLGLHTRN